MLDVNFINPFISATMQALEMMAAVRPSRGTPFVKADHVAKGDISGVIGLAGDTTGSVAITFPAGLALKIYKNLVGEDATGLSDEVRDAIGELANMIAGGAKADLSLRGCNFQIAIPTIVVGPGHSIDHRGQGPCLVVPFTLDGQNFWLEVSMS